jgi:hypothetical protein
MRASWLPRIKYGPEVFVDDSAVRRNMHATVEWIDHVIAPLSSDDLVQREFAHGAALARHAARRVLGEATRSELDALCAEHVALWPRRNRPGGLRDSLAKLAASKAFL